MTQRVMIDHPQANPGHVVWANAQQQYDDWTALFLECPEAMTECYVELAQRAYPARARQQGFWLHAAVKNYSHVVGHSEAWIWRILGEAPMVLYKRSPDGPTIVYVSGCSSA